MQKSRLHSNLILKARLIDRFSMRFNDHSEVAYFLNEVDNATWNFTKKELLQLASTFHQAGTIFHPVTQNSSVFRLFRSHNWQLSVDKPPPPVFLSVNCFLYFINADNVVIWVPRAWNDHWNMCCCSSYGTMFMLKHVNGQQTLSLWNGKFEKFVNDRT